MEKIGLIQNLHKLNESERFYQEYYSIRNDPKQLALFVERIDPVFLDKNYLVIPEKDNFFPPISKRICFLLQIKARIS